MKPAINGNGRSYHKLNTPLTQYKGVKTMTAEAMALMNSDDTAELLGRLDERTRNLPQALSSLDAKIDAHDSRLRNVEISVDALSPVKKVVYGGVVAILLAVIGAAMGIILSSKSDTKTIEQIVNKAVQQTARQ